MKYEKIDFFWKKKYLIRFIAGMVGYGFMLPFAIFISKKIQAGILIKILLALLPVIPFLLAMYAYIANMKTMDEMWRKIQIDALIITTMITIAASFSMGMLQVMNVMKTFSVFYLFPFMMMVWLFSFSYLIAKNKLL